VYAEAEGFGAFTHAHTHAGDDFDGTPGGLDSFSAESFEREARPSPGLSRGGDGCRFGGGFGFGATSGNRKGARGMGVF
jgi:hypothetical protein